MAQDDRFVSRVFYLAVVAFLGYLLFRILRPFVGPILWAFLISFLLFPINHRVRETVRGRKGLAAAALTVAVALGIVIPAALAIVALARQAVDLGQSLSQSAGRYRVESLQDISRIPGIGGALHWLEKNLALDPAQLQEWAVQAAQRFVQFLLTQSRDLLLGTLGFVGDLVLMLFILFFFFRDGDAMAARIRGLVPLDAKRKRVLDRHLQDVTRAVVFGTVITALVQGTLLGLAFWISGLPSPLVFGAMGAIASFIPLVGTGLLWVPAAIYLVSQGAVWKAVFMALWGLLVVGMVDNFLRPLLVSGRAEMGTLTVFFGVLGGLAAFGMIGLFFGPVILALAIALVQFAEESRARPPEVPGGLPP